MFIALSFAMLKNCLIFLKFNVVTCRRFYVCCAVITSVFCAFAFLLGGWATAVKCARYLCLKAQEPSKFCTFQARRNQDFQIGNGPEDPNKGHLPDFIGIGIKKCGTGIYMNFLKRHGSFRLPIWENYETEYFTKRKSCGLQWYLNRFRTSEANKYFIEKTPHYFYAAPQSIPQDILDLNPRIKVFLLLCDPTLRAYSCYVHYHSWGFFNRKSQTVKQFESFVLREVPKLQSLLSQLNDSGKEEYLLESWNGSLECLTAGLYFIHMKRWMNHFNKSQMLVLNGDDLMENPGPEYIKIQKFFGVPQRIQPEDWVKRKTTGHFCLRPPENRSQLFCQDGGFRKARTRTLMKESIKEKPRLEVMDKLRQFYKPYNDELFKIIKTKFNWG